MIYIWTEIFIDYINFRNKTEELAYDFKSNKYAMIFHSKP